MRDRRLVDTELGGDIVLAEVFRLPKVDESRMDGPVVTFTRDKSTSLPFHDTKVDQHSTFVNVDLSTDSLRAVKRSECMGDARHKKSPPEDREEIVTDDFRQRVRDTLDNNARSNRLKGKKKGQPGFLICDRAGLADACDTDITMINKIIGPARSTSKVDLVDRSTFLGRIRRALDIDEISIAVPTDRAEIVAFIASLPDADFKRFDEAVRDLMRESGKVPR